MQVWRSHRTRLWLFLLTAAALSGAATGAWAQAGRETNAPQSLWLPEPVSSFGRSVDHLFYYILYLTVTINILVFIALIAFLIKYRYKAGRHATFIHGNNRLETVWTLVPTVILALTAVFSESVWSNIKVPSKSLLSDKDTLEIEVVAQQFLWNFHYPGKDGKLGPRVAALINKSGSPDEQIGVNRGDNVVLKTGETYWGTVSAEDEESLTLDTKVLNKETGQYDDTRVVVPKSRVASRNQDGADDFVTNVLYIPVNRKVYIHLASRDVIHSFYLPNFRVKQDAVPGMNTRVWLEAEKTSAEAVGRDEKGRPKPFDIACAELCGQGHFKMRGQMYVVTAEEFKAFIDAKTKAQGESEEGYQ